MKKYILFVISGFILQGCVAKNQDMYADAALADRHERSVSVSKAVQTYIAPVAVIPGALVVGTIQGVGEVATYAAENPELIQQGINTYQQVEYEQRIDRERAYRASEDLRKSINKSSASSQNNRRNYNSESNRYNRTEGRNETNQNNNRVEAVTYVCYTLLSEVMAASLPRLKKVAKIDYDKCDFSHKKNTIECKPAPSSGYIYRDAKSKYPCENKKYFDTIGNVYQSVIDLHKRTGREYHYYGNEKLIRL